MLTVAEKDYKPVCPHCGAELEELGIHKMKSGFGKRFTYTCPHCRKVLGVSHRKGFWMG